MGRPFKKSGGGGTRGMRGRHSSSRGNRGGGGKFGHGNRGGGVNHKRQDINKHNKSVSKSRYFDKKLLASNNENMNEETVQEVKNVPSHSSKLLIGLQKFDAAFSKTANLRKDKSLMTDKKKEQVQNKLSAKLNESVLNDLVTDDDPSEDGEDISEAESEIDNNKKNLSASESDENPDFDDMSDEELDSDDDDDDDEDEDDDDDDVLTSENNLKQSKKVNGNKEVENDEELDSGEDGEELDSAEDGEELDSGEDGEELDSGEDGEELDSAEDVEELDSEEDDEELDSEEDDEELDSEDNIVVSGKNKVDKKASNSIVESKLSQSNKIQKSGDDPKNKKSLTKESSAMTKSQIKGASEIHIPQAVLPILKSQKMEPISEEQLHQMRVKALEQVHRVACQVLFVKPIPREYTVAQLRQLFRDAINVRIPFHERTGHNRGYAFVDFKTRSLAERARKAINGKVVSGKPLQVILNAVDESARSFAVEEYDFKCLFVTGLVKEVTKLDVRQVFPGAEKITFSTTKQKHSVGYCFVFFHDEVLSISAFMSSQLQQIKGQGISVTFRKIKQAASHPMKVEKKEVADFEIQSVACKRVAQDANESNGACVEEDLSCKLAPSKKKCRFSVPPQVSSDDGEGTHLVASTVVQNSVHVVEESPRDSENITSASSKKKLKRKSAPPISAFKKYTTTPT